MRSAVRHCARCVSAVVRCRRACMDFIAGVDIPQPYVPFLTEELSLDGPAARELRVAIDAPAAARDGFPIVIVGAGMSGLLMGLSVKRAGLPSTIVEANADVGGTWFANQYPGSPRRYAQPPLQLFVRRRARVAEAVFDRRRPPRLFRPHRRRPRPSRSHPLQHWCRSGDVGRRRRGLAAVIRWSRAPSSAQWASSIARNIPICRASAALPDPRSIRRGGTMMSISRASASR